MTSSPAPVLDGSYDARVQLRGGVESVFKPCHRCGGSGAFGPVQIYNGVCFECAGDKGTWVPLALAVKRSKANIARRARVAKQAAEKAAAQRSAAEIAMDTFRAAYPDLAFMVELAGTVAGDDVHPILVDMSVKLGRYGSLSEKQVAFARKLVIQEAEKAEAKAICPPAPTGRQVVTGLIAMTKFYDNDFGGTWKLMLVTDAGWKVFMTVPNEIKPDSYTGGYEHEEGSFAWHMAQLKGKRLEVTATLKVGDDPTFAKGSVPKKARLLADEVVNLD